jgi:FAD/FMN-containing dehydrogenase
MRGIASSRMRDYLQALRAAPDAVAFVESAGDTDRFLQDARGGCGAAAAVILPRTIEQVSLAVSEAVRRKIRLVPQGANTGLVGAGIPEDASNGVVLSLAKLEAAAQIDAANRSATVGAGLLLSSLNLLTEPAGLFFPIDIAADPSVGGMIAANTGGSRFLRYGDVRRNVLGLEVVLPDENGTVLDLTAPLWKNNAGVDLKQLFIGTSGSFGIITRATLALQPLPKSRCAALLIPRDESAVVRVLLALEAAAGPALSAFEGMSRAALAAALAHVPSLRNPFANAQIPEFVVLLELTSTAAGNEDALLDMLQRAVEPLMSGGEPLLHDAMMGAAHDLWRVRHAIPEGIRKSGKVVACDVAVARSKWAALRTELKQRVQREWPQALICDFGHVGDGGLHFNVVLQDTQADGELLERIRVAVFDIVVSRFGGTFSAEHGIGPRNQRYYQQYTPPGVLSVAGSIQRLLNPLQLGMAHFGADTARHFISD